VKIAVFDDWRVGLVEGEQLFDVTAALPSSLAELPEQRINWLIGRADSALPALAEARRRAAPVPLSSAQLRPPSPRPRHIFAAPANYRKHIGELGTRTVTKAGRSAREQGFFLKAPGSLVGAGDAITLPRGSKRRFDHESELGVIVGRGGFHVPRERAMDHVFGYACLIDASMRIEPGVAEEERSMRKSFQGFTPLGPWLVTADEIADPSALRNRLWVNGELRQDAGTGEMIVGIAELIELISSVLPLTPGDVIATGTPEGVGPLVVGDTVTIEIEQVGRMTVQVREHDEVAPRAY
jgi:2-keto-4-pentenoate hydratase/2-oxohepta-3-ene-1,7-dioic acid hydratase in catechol pathway